MAGPKKSRSLLEQIADLDDPTPKDFDPEGHQALQNEPHDSESDVDGGDDDRETRIHYAEVGKSTIREHDEVALGRQYAGARVDRDHLAAEDTDDDPFGSGGSGESQQDESEGSGGADYDDPDDVDLPGVGGQDEDIDSEEAFEDGDEKWFQGFQFRGSRTRKSEGMNGVEDHDHSGDEVESGSSEEGLFDDDSMVSSHEQDEKDSPTSTGSDDESMDGESDIDHVRPDDRAALRKMMAEEQKSVVATISQATKADAEKGTAVRQQRSTFDALLNTRIRLQKSLVATNSISGHEGDSRASINNEAIQAAETAALTLWNNLNTLRSGISPKPTSAPSNPKKRPFSATISTASSLLWDNMTAHEGTHLPLRRNTLNKWSEKVHIASTLPTHNKLTNQPTHQSLTSVLDAQLSPPNLDRLIQPTKTPRSCAPIQAAASQSKSSTTTNTTTTKIQPPNPPPSQIYDDADFYTLLLRELVDQRISDPNPKPHPSSTIHPLPLQNLTLTAHREAKSHRQVDTKASKGRKMRYTVHEKLMDFMAPDDRLLTWGGRQVDELFGGLLGRRRVEIGEGEEEGEGEGERNGDGDGGEEEGLRLFRS
ncbi:rRNA-processing protein bfr2 [Bachmanniomyces sp. S44760]|nr:rRNA-processing protein bfr2 [Bachmanniomyces sp. S44760]